MLQTISHLWALTGLKRFSSRESGGNALPPAPLPHKDSLSHFLASLVTVYGVMIVERGLGAVRVFLFAGLLGREGFGAFSLAVSFVSLFLPLSTLSLPSACSRYVPEYERRGSLRIFFRRGYALLGAATVLLFLVSQIQAKRLSQLVYGGEEFAGLIRVACWTLAFSSVNAFGLAALRGLRQFRSTSLLELLQTALSTGFGAALLLLVARRPEWAMGANAGAVGLGSLVFAAVLGRQSRGWAQSNDIEPLGPFSARLLSFSGSYLATAILTAGFSFLSKWMVNAFVSLEQTGVFGFAMNLAQMLTILFTAFNLVLSPYLAAMWIGGRRRETEELLHLVAKITLLVLAEGALFLQIAAEAGLPRLMPEYAGGLGILRILIAAQLCNASVWTFGQYANLVERPNLKILASGLGLGLFGVLASWLGPTTGVSGVSWSFFGAQAAVLGITLYYSVRIGLPLNRSVPLALAIPAVMAVPGLAAEAGVAVALLLVAGFTPLVFSRQEKTIVAQAFRLYYRGSE